MNISARAIAAALVAFALTAGGVTAASAAEGSVPVEYGDQTGAGAVVSDVSIIGDDTGFLLEFDYALQGDPAPEFPTPIYLGVYRGGATEYPFSSGTHETHGYGLFGDAQNPGSSVIVDAAALEAASGTVSQHIDVARADELTVIVYGSAPCDCAPGTIPLAGAQLPALVVAPLPLTTTVPTIAGTAEFGSTLTATATGWTPGTTITWQWRISGTPVAGATARTWTVPANAVGKPITVVASGTKLGYVPASRTSAAVTGVAKTLKAPVPTIPSSAKVGVRITATAGAWTKNTKLTYQWRANDVVIAGATAASYVPTAAVVGKRLTVRVTGTLSGYATVTKASARTAAVVAGTLSGAVPKISGTAIVGSTLKVTAGTWTAGTTLKYQWFAAGRAISGATSTSYKPTAAVVGSPITVRVTGTKSGYTALAKTSVVTGKVKPGTLTAPAPKLSGTAQLGSKITATAGTWTAGTSLKYQWYLNGVAISGATKSSVAISSVSWKGKKLTVRITGTKPGYTTRTVTSAATAAITVPGRTTPGNSGTTCPAWAPIKGNASSMIYHMPGQRFYNATHPEDCFSTESAAKNAGYRKAKV